MKKKWNIAIVLTSPSGEKWILTPAPSDLDVLYAWMDKTKIPFEDRGVSDVSIGLSFALLLKTMLTTKSPMKIGETKSATLKGWSVVVTGIKKNERSNP